MKKWVILCLVLLLTGSAPAAGLSLEITVKEPAGVARTSWPVSGGIPLPWGRFQKDQPFALFDGGNEIPVQVTPHVVDGDGFIRWVLLDFQTDLGANETKMFTLKAQKPTVEPDTPLKLTQPMSTPYVVVNTGKVVLRFDSASPVGLAAVSAGGKEIVTGASASYTDATRMVQKGGERVRVFDTFAADQARSVEVEYAGPLRATVKVTGRFQGDDKTKMLYIARFTLWAGRSDVLVKYTLANSNPDHYCFRKIGDSSLALDLANEPNETLLGANEPLEAGAEAWLHQGLRGGYPGGARAGKGGEETWRNKQDERAHGWIRAGGVAVADLYFADNPPRRLETKAGDLVLHGITDRYNGVKDRRGRVRGQPWNTDHLILMDSTHYSSQYRLDFAAPADAEKLNQWARAAQYELHAMAPPRWYFDTEGLAVGQFATQKDELNCYDVWGWDYDPKRAPKSPGYKIPKGRYVRGADNHYDTEEDVSESLLLMYLRTGRRPFYRAAKAWNNYNMDLQQFRTDGWRYKDGAVWWNRGGPAGGNRPQRTVDPVTGWRNYLPKPWTKTHVKRGIHWTKTDYREISFLVNSKQCYCHNYGSGLAAWFCITGDRDALEAAIDSVEQNIDSQKRSKRKYFKKTDDGHKVSAAGSFSRDFTRSCYLTNAVRLVVPTDEFVCDASDHLTEVYLRRPRREPRGFVNPPGKITMKTIRSLTGTRGVEEMKKRGIKLVDGQLVDPKTGAKWYPLANPHIWMFTYLSPAMECYYRQVPNEDVHDWIVAYGQAVAHVLWQEKHQNLAYGRFLVDFPVKGFAWDHASWHLPDDTEHGEGFKINGYLARFHPDICARAYSLTGVPFLKQRAYDFWNGGSHRGYNASKPHHLGAVGTWVNCVGVHSESVCLTGRTFHIWSHPRKDEAPPAAVKDLEVQVDGEKAFVSFTAPKDPGGKVVRYQVKCSDKPLVGYVEFLGHWAKDTDDTVTNWWMAANLDGEPAPKAAGTKETFVVTGVPQGATHFAVRAFDDSRNRSPLGNLAQAE
ncbi:MAG: hypothetical protein ACOC8E_03985 [Planctomycetota bacterium]